MNGLQDAFGLYVSKVWCDISAQSPVHRVFEKAQTKTVHCLSGPNKLCIARCFGGKTSTILHKLSHPWRLNDDH